MVLKLPWAQKRMFWAFEKSIFQFYANFWVTKLKPFSGKVRQSVQNYFNQNLVIGNFLKNDFEATLSSKTNVVSVWKGHFSDFYKFLSDEVKQSVYNYLNQNLAIGSFLEKGFQAQKLKLWMFERGIFQIFNNFWVAKLKPFSGIPRQCWKNFFDKVYFAQSILESAFQSLFDHSRQSLLEILNISNVLNVAIWIFNWS